MVQQRITQFLSCQFFATFDVFRPHAYKNAELLRSMCGVCAEYVRSCNHSRFLSICVQIESKMEKIDTTKIDSLG
jgi:hypothetical protein